MRRRFAYLNRAGECSSFWIDAGQSLARSEIRDFNDAAVSVDQNVVALNICKRNFSDILAPM